MLLLVFAVWNHIYQPSASPLTSPQPGLRSLAHWAPPATVTPAALLATPPPPRQAPAAAVHPDHQQRHQQHNLKKEAPQQLATAVAPTRRIRIRTTTAAATTTTTAVVIATTTVYLNGKYAWLTAFSPQYLGEHLLTIVRILKTHHAVLFNFLEKQFLDCRIWQPTAGSCYLYWLRMPDFLPRLDSSLGSGVGLSKGCQD